MQKLQAEIDTLDASETISYRQTQQLPYLKAVIRESLRMYPSIPAQLPRNVPAGGMTVDGQFIPSGTIVGISGLAQNRDSGIFGRDVDTFNPERWLGDETKARYLEASLFNFGGTGPRSCPGRDLAMVSYKRVDPSSILIRDRSSCTNLSLRWFRSLISSCWTRNILLLQRRTSLISSRTCP